LRLQRRAIRSAMVETLFVPASAPAASTEMHRRRHGAARHPARAIRRGRGLKNLRPAELLGAAAKSLSDLRPAELLGATAAKPLSNLRPPELFATAMKARSYLGAAELLGAPAKSFG
jgi:hypothetical protein